MYYVLAVYYPLELEVQGGGGTSKKAVVKVQTDPKPVYAGTYTYNLKPMETAALYLYRGDGI